ncbi:MAG: biopolymer transport protein TolR [Lentimonas sp.]|jgi:biopolymer transport protein TolR
MAFNTGSKNSRKRSAAMSDINITPFVDVLLVLLIIFMVAAPMMTGSVELNLPKGISEANQSKIEPISISIQKDGSIFLQDEKILLKSLAKKLTEITGSNVDRKIFVNADTKINYGRVMEAVRTINAAGFTQVSLVTELES